MKKCPAAAPSSRLCVAQLANDVTDPVHKKKMKQLPSFEPLLDNRRKVSDSFNYTAAEPAPATATVFVIAFCLICLTETARKTI